MITRKVQPAVRLQEGHMPYEHQDSRTKSHDGGWRVSEANVMWLSITACGKVHVSYLTEAMSSSPTSCMVGCAPRKIADVEIRPCQLFPDMSSCCTCMTTWQKL
jgi:hypothetical protein